MLINGQFSNAIKRKKRPFSGTLFSYIFLYKALSLKLWALGLNM
jgi:hypothetical protein